MKQCSQCRETKPVDEFYRDRSSKDGRRSTCKGCHNVLTYGWRERNPDRLLQIQRRHHQRHRDSRLAQHRAYYLAHQDEMKARERERYSSLKDAAYAAYGGFVCACCGETERAFLCIDHVNNDGHQHRKEVSPRSLTYWLKEQGYPLGFQVLCFNCNQGKRMNGGVCPHQAKASELMQAIYGIDIMEV